MTIAKRPAPLNVAAIACALLAPALLGACSSRDTVLAEQVAAANAAAERAEKAADRAEKAANKADKSAAHVEAAPSEPADAQAEEPAPGEPMVH